MSLQEQIGKMVNEQIATAIADKVMESVNEQLKEKWNTVIAELVSHRKRSEQLSTTIETLEAKVNSLKSYVDTAQEQARISVEAQRKANRLLDEALKELNIEE